MSNQEKRVAWDLNCMEKVKKMLEEILRETDLNSALLFCHGDTEHKCVLVFEKDKEHIRAIHAQDISLKGLVSFFKSNLNDEEQLTIISELIKSDQKLKVAILKVIGDEVIERVIASLFPKES